MALTEPRLYYKPFEYPQAFEFYKDQHRVHWLADEIPLASDLSDWKGKLTESEKNLVGNILKSFAQTEVHVNDYWSTKVSAWFPKPEIQAAARACADFESIHAESYFRLNEELGLDNIVEFMEDPATAGKLERLIETPGNTLEERALSLAILCWLFRILIDENPELGTPKFTQAIYEACDMSVQLEFNFIDKAFEMGDIEGLSKSQLKNFIKERANQKLIELGYNRLYNDIDPNMLKQMEWFGHLTNGKSHTDFFSTRVTDYSKSTADWSDL